MFRPNLAIPVSGGQEKMIAGMPKFHTLAHFIEWHSQY